MNEEGFNMEKINAYTGINDSEGGRIFYGSTLVDEAGQLWLVVEHPYLSTPYIKVGEDTSPIPLRGELKKKWMVTTN